MTMKKILLIIIYFINPLSGYSQHFEFQYDASGNRIYRDYIVPRLANPEQFVQEQNLGISVFPNPSPDKINIKIETLENGESAIIIFSDEAGKIIIRKEQTSIQDEITLETFKSGIYYIKVFYRKEEIVYKIVKL